MKLGMSRFYWRLDYNNYWGQIKSISELISTEDLLVDIINFLI